MNIVGRRVVLRAIEQGDLPILHRWANDPELQRMLGGWHHPTSMQDQNAWFASLSCQSANQRFAIDSAEDGLLGTVNLVSIDWKNRSAIHGVMLGNPSGRGKGYGTDAIMAIARYAFDELQLERLDSDIIEYNTRSLRTHTEHCGWTIDGRRPRGYYRAGRYWDKVLIGITRDRYREFVAATAYWD